MKKLLVFIPAFLLVFAACQMPGVEEMAEEIEGQVDDISGQVESVTEETDELRDRISVIEEQITSATGDIELPEFNTDELMEALDEQFNSISTRTDSLLGIVTESNDSLIQELTVLLEEQALVIDSLKTQIMEYEEDIEGLAWEISSLDSRIDALGANAGDSGRTGSTSSSGGRGSTSGGTSGGSSGGRL